MTTRPFTFLLAAALAGMVATGVPLAALLLNWWLGWPPVDWRLSLLLLTGVPVFLGVSWQLMAADNALAVQQRQADIDAQEVKTQAARLALEAATAGGDEQPQSDHRATAVAVLRFMRAGDALGFTFDNLHDAGVVEWDAWSRLTEFYKLWPEAGPVLVCRGGSAPTEWGPSWHLGRVNDLVALGELPLPPGAPPVVNGDFVLKHNTNTRKNTKRAAVGTVVDGVAREVGQ